MDENKKLILAALAIMLGGNAGSVVNAYRSDAFTSLDAAKLEARLIDELHSKYDSSHLRIARLEYQMQHCMNAK